MKKGDSVYCVKTYVSSFNERLFSIGQVSTIEDVSFDLVFIGERKLMMKIKNKCEITDLVGTVYFITRNYQRKMKLKKLKIEKIS